MTTLAPGMTLSHYRILEELGQGGQATAFKAFDVRLSRTVVIKALRPDLASSETARRRFEREAALCSVLENPHIQAVYDVGETGGLYYIVLQYVEGPTLKQFMNGRPLETLGALSIAIQLADALAVAHGCGVAHRDLKPANIIVGPGGQAKILDFGLAKMLVARRTGRARRRAPTTRSPRWACPTARWATALPSRPRARWPITAATCSASASCSTRWSPASRPSAAATRSRC
jgi:serine/threonine protein kinase